MRKSIRVQSLLVIATVSLASFPFAIASTSFSTSSALGEGLATEKGRAISAAIRQNNQKSLWDWLFGKKKGRGGSRRVFCTIWPSSDDPELRVTWHDRPLFIWKNSTGTDRETELTFEIEAKRIEVLANRRDDGEDPLWSHDVTGNEQSIRYGGSAALEPGRRYYLRVIYEILRKDQEGTIVEEKQTKPILFEIDEEESEKRKSVSNELKSLTSQSQTMSAEEFTLQRAKIFAEHGYWADVVQEIFSVQEPSPELASVIEKIRTEDQCTVKPKPESAS